MAPVPPSDCNILRFGDMSFVIVSNFIKIRLYFAEMAISRFSRWRSSISLNFQRLTSVAFDRDKKWWCAICSRLAEVEWTFKKTLIKIGVLYGPCQTQLCCATRCATVGCLTSRVAQLNTSRATKLIDRNRLYSSAISRSVDELWLVSCLFRLHAHEFLLRFTWRLW